LIVNDVPWFHTTVNDKPDSVRRHRNLFMKLKRLLRDDRWPSTRK